MRGAPKSAVKRFKANEGGYSGHHTRRPTDPDKRLFGIKIQTPLGSVFDGTVSFSLTYEVAAAMQAKSAVTCDAQVIRAGSKTGGG